jgi:protein TonB
VAESLLISKVMPVYPAIAKAAHVSGTVELAGTISRVGAIENLRVISGNPMLTRAAMDAVQQWRYRPYQLNGEAVDVETTIRVVFLLGGQ